MPELRELAQQLLAEQQAQIGKMQTWRRAWSKAQTSRPTDTAPRHR